MRLNLLSKLRQVTYLAGISLLLAGIPQGGNAEFGRLGQGKLDTVRSASVKSSCSYRVRGTLSASKGTVYDMGYLSEDLNTKTITLEGVLTQSQVTELTSNSTNVFVSSKPSPLSSPTPDPSFLLRARLFSATAAKLEIVTRGTTFALNPAFFTLDQECAMTNPISTSSTNGCPMLAFKDIATGRCNCAYPPLSTMTVCNYPLTYSQSNTGYPSTPLPAVVNPPAWMVTEPGATIKVGPVTDPVLQNAYVFDENACACKLCDPVRYKKSADNRSCLCRFQNRNEIISSITATQVPNSYPQPATYYTISSPTVPSFSPGGGAISVPSDSDLVKCYNKWAIFDPATCSCKECPPPTFANADGSACVQ